MTLLNKELNMGPKARREREKVQLRQEILDAARELFVKEGYENVSMRRIADKIEYSPTTIYLYFEDKTELFFAICEETFAKLSKKLEVLAKEGKDPVENLRKGCRSYVDFGLKHPNHYKLTFINFPALQVGKEHYLREESAGMKAYEHMRQAVQECIDKKKLRDSNADAVSQALWAVIHGLTSLLVTKPDFPWVKKDQLIELTINSVIKGLLL
ncbi:MAG: TetR/AcrR family transcriptional regulator [Acidobacteria bacterium]|nr:TetR/AcrR family transcriptional regulator [Acidobacteriota bacterium]